MSSEGHSLVIKAKHKEELRRWQMELADLSYDRLRRACAERFGLAECQLQYRDEEGDMIRMNSEADLQEALTQTSVLMYVVVEAQEGQHKPVKERTASPEQTDPSLQWCVGSTSTIQGMITQAFSAAMGAQPPGQSPQPDFMVIARNMMQAFNQPAASQNSEQSTGQTSAPGAVSGLRTLLSSPIVQQLLVSFLTTQKNGTQAAPTSERPSPGSGPANQTGGSQMGDLNLGDLKALAGVLLSSPMAKQLLTCCMTHSQDPAPNTAAAGGPAEATAPDLGAMAEHLLQALARTQHNHTQQAAHPAPAPVPAPPPPPAAPQLCDLLQQGLAAYQQYATQPSQPSQQPQLSGDQVCGVQSLLSSPIAQQLVSSFMPPPPQRNPDPEHGPIPDDVD